ncbi:MAG: hypothetical protein CMLOHMNK_02050 [Steroidobacteraceae bacterium]|nr:hypothetical protein [Steroidobacteraceae bacterium]
MAASLIKNKVAFGHYLANLLKERQVERKELARQLKISETFLSYVIQGKKGMSWDTLEALAKSFELTTSELLNQSGALDRQPVHLPDVADRAPVIHSDATVDWPCRYCELTNGHKKAPEGESGAGRGTTVCHSALIVTRWRSGWA